jgi:hypothetical protein
MAGGIRAEFRREYVRRQRLKLPAHAVAAQAACDSSLPDAGSEEAAAAAGDGGGGNGAGQQRAPTLADLPLGRVAVHLPLPDVLAALCCVSRAVRRRVFESHPYLAQLTRAVRVATGHGEIRDAACGGATPIPEDSSTSNSSSLLDGSSSSSSSNNNSNDCDETGAGGLEEFLGDDAATQDDRAVGSGTKRRRDERDGEASDLPMTPPAGALPGAQVTMAALVDTHAARSLLASLDRSSHALDACLGVVALHARRTAAALGRPAVVAPLCHGASGGVLSPGATQACRHALELLELHGWEPWPKTTFSTSSATSSTSTSFGSLTTTARTPKFYAEPQQRRLPPTPLAPLPALSLEQQRAVAACVAMQPGTTMVLEARAGTGKTTALAAMARAWIEAALAGAAGARARVLYVAFNLAAREEFLARIAHGWRDCPRLIACVEARTVDSIGFELGRQTVPGLVEAEGKFRLGGPTLGQITEVCGVETRAAARRVLRAVQAFMISQDRKVGVQHVPSGGSGGGGGGGGGGGEGACGAPGGGASASAGSVDDPVADDGMPSPPPAGGSASIGLSEADAMSAESVADKAAVLWSAMTDPADLRVHVGNDALCKLALLARPAPRLARVPALLLVDEAQDLTPTDSSLLCRATAELSTAASPGPVGGAPAGARTATRPLLPGGAAPTLPVRVLCGDPLQTLYGFRGSEWDPDFDTVPEERQQQQQQQHAHHSHSQHAHPHSQALAGSSFRPTRRLVLRVSHRLGARAACLASRIAGPRGRVVGNGTLGTVCRPPRVGSSYGGAQQQQQHQQHQQQQQQQHQQHQHQQQHPPAVHTLCRTNRGVREITDAAGGAASASTVHKAKGLEYDTVVLHDDFGSLDPRKLEAAGRETAEERTNIAYVAVTRARRRLVVNQDLAARCTAWWGDSF